MIEQVEQPGAALVGEVRAYLEQAPAESGACGEHDPGWLDVLREGLNHRPIMLIARSDGRGGGSDQNQPSSGGLSGGSSGGICGYLPLALVASRLFGRFLVSCSQ